MKLIFLGAPGAGKGTQAARISAALAIPAISTGDIIREAIRSGSPLGTEFKSYIDKGALVPDELVVELVKVVMLGYYVELVLFQIGVDESRHRNCVQISIIEFQIMILCGFSNKADIKISVMRYKQIISYKGNVFGVEPPTFVELAVAQTDPGFAGNTATNTLKPATLETGAEIKVPLFINVGDMLKIDTRTGEYLSRA